MATDILINGRYSRSVDATDRGLAYGHGLFETITLDGNQPVAWTAHMQRLAEGCRRLNIPCDTDTLQILADELKVLLHQQQGAPQRQILKLILSRGCGGRGYAVAGTMPITRILMLSPYPEYPAQPSQNGINTLLCQSRLARSEQLSGIKHLNRLEQVLARAEWDSPDIAEGLVMDTEGFLIEGTMSNLFWVAKGELYTPQLSLCGVRGIVRQRIIELAETIGIKVNTGNYRPSVLQHSDEIFVCNSVIGLWPVISCKTDITTELNRAVGPVSRQLQQLLAAEGIY